MKRAISILIALALLCWAQYFPPSGGTGGNLTATYILKTADATLTNAQALGSLATGVVKNTTTTGILSIAAYADLPKPTCTVGTWSYGACEVKATYAYTDLTAADVTQDFTLTTLPASSRIVGISIYHTTAFSGTNLTALTVSLGLNSGAKNQYAAAWNVFQAAATTTVYNDGGFVTLDSAAHAIVAHFIGTFSNSKNFSNAGLAQGSVTVWLRYVPLT